MRRVRRSSPYSRHPRQNTAKQKTRSTSSIPSLQHVKVGSSSGVIPASQSHFRRLATTTSHHSGVSNIVSRRTFSIVPESPQSPEDGPAFSSSPPPPPPPPPEDLYHDAFGVDVGLDYVRCAIYKNNTIIPIKLQDQENYPAVVAVSKVGTIKAGFEALEEKDNHILYKLMTGFKYAMGDVPNAFLEVFNESPLNKYKAILTRDARTEKEIYFVDPISSQQSTPKSKGKGKKDKKDIDAEADAIDAEALAAAEKKKARAVEAVLNTPFYRVFDKVFPTDALLKAIYADCKKYSEAYTNTALTKACAAVPNDYTPLQRVKVAQTLAAVGIHTPLVVNESIAAGYGILNELSEIDGYFFLFDFGIQTRVHLYLVQNGVLSVVQEFSDLHSFNLNNLDDSILHVLSTFIGTQTGFDVLTDGKAKDDFLREVRKMRTLFETTDSPEYTIQFQYRDPRSIVQKYTTESAYLKDRIEFIRDEFNAIRDLMDKVSPNSKQYAEYKAKLEEYKKDRQSVEATLEKLHKEFAYDMQLEGVDKIPQELKKYDHIFYKEINIHPIKHTFTRDHFHDIYASLLEPTIRSFITLHQANLPTISQYIDGKYVRSIPRLNFCLPIGTGARSPAVQRVFQHYTRPDLHKDLTQLDTAYVTAGGAARYANVAIGRASDIILCESALQSVGFLGAGDIFDRVVKRGTMAPYSRHYHFTRKLDYTDMSFSLHLLQGDRGYGYDNDYLEEIIVDIPEIYRARGKLDVIISLESDDGQSEVVVKIFPKPKTASPFASIQKLFDANRSQELAQAKDILSQSFSKLYNSTYARHFKTTFEFVSESLEIEPPPDIILEQRVPLLRLNLQEYENILNDEKKSQLRDGMLFDTLDIFYKAKALLPTIRTYLRTTAQVAPIPMKLRLALATTLCKLETKNVEFKVFKPGADMVDPEDFRIRSMVKSYQFVKSSKDAIDDYISKLPYEYETVFEYHPITSERYEVQRIVPQKKPPIHQRIRELLKNDPRTLAQMTYTSVILPAAYKLKSQWNYWFPITRSIINSSLYKGRRLLLRFRITRWLLSMYYFHLDSKERQMSRERRKLRKQREKERYENHINNSI